jgi:hypothetical protein
MADNCARCGQKVKSEENWMRAHLWGTGLLPENSAEMR